VELACSVMNGVLSELKMTRKVPDVMTPVKIRESADWLLLAGMMIQNKDSNIKFARSYVGEYFTANKHILVGDVDVHIETGGEYNPHHPRVRFCEEDEREEEEKEEPAVKPDWSYPAIARGIPEGRARETDVAALGSPGTGRRHRQLDLVSLGMQTGQSQCGLIAVAGLASDGVQQKRSGGNCFGTFVGIRQPREQTPPVVNQGDEQSHHLAARVIVRREAEPAPLVLQLVKIVLRVASVAVVLGQRENLIL